MAWVAEAGGDMSYDWMRYVVTRYEPGDGPQNMHIVLLDNNRSTVLADDVGRDALRCIRCSACSRWPW